MPRRGDGVAAVEHEQPCGGEEGAEREPRVARCPSARGERDAGRRSRQRREQHDARERLPSEPCTERREQLEVAMAHAIATGRKPESMVYGPEERRSRPSPR